MGDTRDFIARSTGLQLAALKTENELMNEAIADLNQKYAAAIAERNAAVVTLKHYQRIVRLIPSFIRRIILKLIRFIKSFAPTEKSALPVMIDDSLKLMPGLSAGTFIYDSKQPLLTLGAWKETGPNIGEKGVNLTISFLSFNRISLTEKLLHSIQMHLPQFDGEILILDNGSSDETLRQLKNIIDTLPLKCRLIELGKNHGIAAGRNLSVKHTRTEWILMLDNDVYFVSDPLPQLQKDIATLSCHFMGLPILASNSQGEMQEHHNGHLFCFTQNNDVFLDCGANSPPRSAMQTPLPTYLVSFLPGYAHVVNCKSFLALGGYDEDLFVGLEDIEFSLRLFQQGLKIGMASGCSIVHDHAKLEIKDDLDYERVRYSKELLKQSAEIIEMKHGVKVWHDAVNDWIESRHQELGLNTNSR